MKKAKKTQPAKKSKTHPHRKHHKNKHAESHASLGKVRNIHHPLHMGVPASKVVYAGAVCAACGYCHVLLKSLPGCPMCQVCSGCNRKVMHCSCKEGE